MSRVKSRTADPQSAVRTAKGQVKAVTPVGRALQVVRDVGSACPYTALGRKAVNAVKGGRQAGRESSSDREHDLLAVVRMGRNVALIGFFCPIFWFSLLSGVRGSQLRFNAMHSGVVILIGCAVVLKGKIALKRERRRG